MAKGKLRAKLRSKFTRRTGDDVKKASSQDPNDDDAEDLHPDYASVESSPWGTFGNHREHHRDPSGGRTTPSLKGLTISTTSTVLNPNVIPEEEENTVQPAIRTIRRRRANDLIRKSIVLKKLNIFKRTCKWAYSIIDSDKSGQIDKKELYTGLLLIHLQLAAFLGPAACRPVTREQANKLFDLMDTDHSGTLSEDEFEQVMLVLCSNIVTRVILLFSMTIVLLPICARYIVSLLATLYNSKQQILSLPLSPYLTAFWNFLTNQISNKRHIIIIMDPIFNSVKFVWNSLYNCTAFLLGKIPKSVMDTIPFTIVSSILGSLLVPWCLFKIDAFFEYMARRKRSGKAKKE